VIEGMADTRDLGKLFDARIPIIAIESPDEPRVLGLLLNLAIARGLAFSQWTVTGGLRRGGIEGPSTTPELREPEALLQHIAATNGPGLYALCDFHPWLDEPTNLRFLKDIALDFDRLGNCIVLVSHRLTIPPEIGRLCASFELRLPSDEELMAMIRREAQEWARLHKGAKVSTDQATLKRLLSNVRGVSHSDARILLRHAIFDDGAITASDLPEMNRLKFELLDSEGVLHFEYDTATFTDVAGLGNLKSWLELRRSAFLDQGTADRPRGVLLCGVQGGGKSLAARAVAGFWGLPLLRLDFGALYNKFFGETERNLRNSLKQAELMSPCVLWMDEIEKGLATGSSDNATSRRVLGTLLTWMAEKRRAVFIVATSNDLTELPPELMRKGRLDEVFFVDLSDAAMRTDILTIHLGKRDLAPADYNLAELADATEGFTGAEIEEAIVSARYLAAANRESVRQDDLLAAVHRTYPISVLRAESIASLRAWAANRTVPA
jgi:AAA+ superfamily predicted ATPase